MINNQEESKTKSINFLPASPHFADYLQTLYMASKNKT